MGGILIFSYNTRICIIIFIFYYYYYNYFFFLGGGGGGGGGSENLIFMEEADFVDTFFWAHVYAFTGVFLSSRYRTGIHFVGI